MDLATERSPLASLEPETLALLQRHGFDRELFEALRTRLSRGELSERHNWAHGTIEPPMPGDVVALPALGSAERERLAGAGRALIQGGKVALVILCGGMATRFGGVVKAAVEVARGKSFLELKLDDVRDVAAGTGGRVPVHLMTSFATDAEVARLARAASTRDVPVSTFTQFVSLRLTPQGQLFRERNGAVSPYATGHGDMPSALRRAGTLSRLRAEGVTHLVMSNVDNLAATLEPAILGAHLSSEKPMSFEVAVAKPGDQGGAPVRLSGELQVLEALRYPPGFDPASVPLFSTNGFVLDVAALDREFELSWFLVLKRVDERQAVQFERLVNQLTAFLPCRGIGIARDGPDNRFVPIKTPQDLERERGNILALLDARRAAARIAMHS
jgi:UTP--glucose-1-phosphate uridylyltransferase